MNADHNAEQAVLGCILQTAGRVTDTLGLRAEDFHAPLHEELWNSIHSYLATGKPLDRGLLLAHLGPRAEALAPVLVDCELAAAIPDTARWHAHTLRTHTARRRIDAAAAALNQLAGTANEMTPDELAEAARGLVDQWTERTVDTGGTTTFGDAVLTGLERWNTPDTDVLATGWHELDEKLTGGLRPGHLTIVGARPAVGKSLIATELARQVAATGTGVLFSSLEMSRTDVADRIASSLTRVPLAALTGGTANDEQMDRLGTLLGRVAHWPLHIDDRATVGVTAIRGKARDITRQPQGLGLIVVDYLQLVSPADRKAPREQQVASVSRGLKLLARDLAVPVVALAQVNRGSTQRDNKRPLMSDLRESGAIEADADEILMLHRDDDTFPGELEVNVIKNRHGETGPLRLGWAPYSGRIANLAPYGSAA
jgi:replicative DNA helicase